MTPTRILTRRRLSAAGAPQPAPPMRRRRRTRGLVQVASAAASERLRLDALGHAYLVSGVVLVGVLFYLGIAAHITQASYDISRLQDQQSQLLAEQDQLRYQEVTLHAPAQAQQQAASGGMSRVVPTKYVTGQPVAINLGAPVGAGPADASPLWMRLMAAAVTTVGGPKGLLAAILR